MATITSDQLKTLFSFVDEKLKMKVDIFIIGGASAILGYNVSKMTNDVDLDGPMPEGLDELFRTEAKKMGIDLYLSVKGIFSPPDGYRARMRFEDFPKKNLRVWTLDKYDLAISKIDRGLQKDFDDIQAVHKRSAYEVGELIRLFNEEYIHVAAMGNPREKKMNLLDLIERLFGESEAEAAQAKIDF